MPESRGRWRWVCAIVTAQIACAKSTSDDAPSPPTRLDFDLPPGFSITIDGADRGLTPVRNLEVVAGDHALVLQTPCGTAKASVAVEAKSVRTVTAEDFAELGFATLSVTVRGLDGTILQPTVSLGDWTAPSSSGAKITVPACKLRLHVSSEGLGGFIEDVDLEAGQEIARDVVLAPGPDMVRIHGGPFTIGPRPEDAEDWLDCCQLRPYPVEVATYDLDRTEVTAGQFAACVEAGACDIKTDLLFLTDAPDPMTNASCTLQMPDRIASDRMRVSDGKHGYPANCVAQWQASAYCQWVGKRLPDDVEWQYAARSRKEAYECPFGEILPGENDCGRSHAAGYFQPHEPCSRPERTSEQGVCDLASNVEEWVTDAVVSGRETYPTTRSCRASEGDRPVTGAVCLPTYERSARIGFRCARSLISK